MSLFQLLEDRYQKAVAAGTDPNFLHDEHGSDLSVRQAYAVVAKLAGQLLARGVKPGSTVAIAVERTVAQPLLEITASLLHCAFIPVDVTRQQSSKSIETNTALLQQADCVVACLEQLTTEQQQVLDNKIISYQALDVTVADPLLQSARARAPIEQQLTANTASIKATVGQTPYNTAYFIASSGSTTGVPTLMAVPPLAIDDWLGSLRGLFTHLQGKNDNHYLSQIGFGFDAHIAILFHALALDMELTIASQETLNSPEKLRALIKEQHITDLLCLPSSANFYDLHAHMAELTASGFRSLQFAGEPVDNIYAEHAETIAIYSLFGATQCGFGSGGMRLTREVMQSFGQGAPIGMPQANADWLVLNEVSGSGWVEVAPGASGELFVVKPHMVDRYIGDDEKFARHFPSLVVTMFSGEVRSYSSGQIFREGELVKRPVIAGESYRSLGRVDLTWFKSHGESVSVLPAEQALLEHPAIANAAIILPRQYATNRHKAFAAVITYRPGSERLSLQQVREYLATKPGVSKFSLPDFLVDNYPQAFKMAVNSKFDRRALAGDPVITGQCQQSVVEPKTELERAIRKIWAAVIGKAEEAISCAASFSMEGGDSLYNVQLIVAMEAELQRLGLILDIHEYIANGDGKYSIALLAKHIFTNARKLQASPLHEHGQPKRLPVELDWLAEPYHQSAAGAVLPPIFLAPGITGNDSRRLQTVARALCARFGRPVYALVDPTYTFGALEKPSMDQFAQNYLRAIRVVQPQGRLTVLGWSFGTHVAQHMAVLEEERGEPIRRLVLLDGEAPHQPEGVGHDGSLDVSQNQAYTVKVNIILRQLAALFPATGGNSPDQIIFQERQFSEADLRQHQPKELLSIIFAGVTTRGVNAAKLISATFQNMWIDLEYCSSIRKLHNTIPDVVACQAGEVRPPDLWWGEHATCGTSNARNVLSADHFSVLSNGAGQTQLLDFLVSRFEADKESFARAAQGTREDDNSAELRELVRQQAAQIAANTTQLAALMQMMCTFAAANQSPGVLAAASFPNQQDERPATPLVVANQQRYSDDIKSATNAVVMFSRAGSLGRAGLNRQNSSSMTIDEVIGNAAGAGNEVGPTSPKALKK